jgi:hypothetical protein
MTFADRPVPLAKRFHRFQPWSDRCRLGAVWLLLAISVGCGDPPTGSVSGRVTFGGHVIGEGNVVFENGEQGLFKAAEIGSDGTYRFDDLPLVEYTVSVRPPEPEVPNENLGFDGRAPLPKAKVAPSKGIPPLYHTTQSSPLRHTVQKGEQKYDIELK